MNARSACTNEVQSSVVRGAEALIMVVELLRSGDNWALSWVGLPVVASVSASITGLKIWP